MPDIDAQALRPDQQEMLRVSIGTGYGLWAGVELLGMGDGQARISFHLRDEMRTPWGTLNGGVISSLVEIPSFIALLGGLDVGELPVTNDIFVQHMRPLPGDRRYEMTGRLLRRGRTMAWTDVTVSAGGEPVSLARITKTIVRQAER